MSRFRVVIIEDEPLARGVVRDLLERDPEVELVGEAGDGESGLELLRRLRPDIAFLDVEMPVMGGVEVASAVDAAQRPAIVFVTAYSDFATDAFDVEALDYVVKPFSDDRFYEALRRAEARVREQRMSGLAERLASEATEMGASGADDGELDSGYMRTIPVPADGGTLLVKTRDVVWIESQDYYARIHTSLGAHLVRASLTSFEQKLDPRRFVRAHRQAIVNADCVVEIENLPKGLKVLVLTDGSRCRVSRSRKAAVEKLLPPKLA